VHRLLNEAKIAVDLGQISPRNMYSFLDKSIHTHPHHIASFNSFVAILV